MAAAAVRYLLKRNTGDYNCVEWGTLQALEPSPGKKVWGLDQVWYAAGSSSAGYIQSGDSLSIVDAGGRYDLVVSRKGVPDRMLQNIQLQGIDDHANLWARVGTDGLDIYLYLLEGGSPRRIHVDVFYIDTSHNAERPDKPGVVEILG